MFAAPSSTAAALQTAGFTLLHLANNHIGDYGEAGLRTTLASVRAAGLAPLGAAEASGLTRQLLRTDFNRRQIGWLGCGRTLSAQNWDGPRYWEFDADELSDAVRQARPDVDALIVSIHIGLMYLDLPHPEHKALAERLMAAGVDLVLMHHAHVLQGVELNGLGHACCYSLGNFLCDSLEGNVQSNVMMEEQREGAVFMFDFDSNGLTSIAVLPTWMNDDCHVTWAVGERGMKILQRLERISRGLKTDYRREFDQQRVQRNFAVTLRVLLFHVYRGNWRYVLHNLQRIRFEHVRQGISYAWRGVSSGYRSH